MAEPQHKIPFSTIAKQTCPGCGNDDQTKLEVLTHPVGCVHRMHGFRCLACDAETEVVYAS